jgi:hypothetical protein
MFSGKRQMLLTTKHHHFDCLRSYQSGASLANVLFVSTPTLVCSTMPYAMPLFHLSANTSNFSSSTTTKASSSSPACYSSSFCSSRKRARSSICSCSSNYNRSSKVLWNSRSSSDSFMHSLSRNALSFSKPTLSLHFKGCIS